MKTFLFTMVLVLIGLTSQAGYNTVSLQVTDGSESTNNTSTVSAEALQTFENGWVTLDYNSLTNTQKNNLIYTWVGLKVAVTKENEANRLIMEAQTAEELAAQLAAIAAKRQQIIDYLTANGFRCDNSQYDWYKLYNRPSVFGSNWQAQADYQMSLSTGVDYFLNIAYTLWKEFNKN